MSSTNDAHLYGIKRHNKLSGHKEISSSTTSSFTSQLSSLINTPKPVSATSSRLRPKKEDLFRKPNRNSAKRAKLDLEDSAYSHQKHTTNGEKLDPGAWERSKRKMEEKARLYAAMKRGDVEDVEEKFSVDFDRKWEDSHPIHGSDDDNDDNDHSEEDEAQNEMVQYTDEFGRTRHGTRAEASRIQRALNSQAELNSDRFTARPAAPSNVIRGDTIQHQAFNPDVSLAVQMEELAKKRDRSLTPPPEEHFDSRQEVRSKGTGFFQFSADPEERKRQMENLEQERLETERVRKQREELSRGEGVGESEEQDEQKSGKRKADDFLEELGEEMAKKKRLQTRDLSSMDAMERIEAAIQQEEEEG